MAEEQRQPNSGGRGKKDEYYSVPAGGRAALAPPRCHEAPHPKAIIPLSTSFLPHLTVCPEHTRAPLLHSDFIPFLRLAAALEMPLFAAPPLSPAAAP